MAKQYKDYFGEATGRIEKTLKGRDAQDRGSLANLSLKEQLDNEYKIVQEEQNKRRQEAEKRAQEENDVRFGNVDRELYVKNKQYIEDVASGKIKKPRANSKKGKANDILNDTDL